LPRRVHAVAGLDDIAHHDRTNGLGGDPAAPQGFADDRGLKLGDWDGLERTILGDDDGANGLTEDDVWLAHDELLQRWERLIRPSVMTGCTEDFYLYFKSRLAALCQQAQQYIGKAIDIGIRGAP
jgi:hypothetical protein